MSDIELHGWDEIVVPARAMFELSPRAYVLYSYLIWRAREKNVTWPGIKRIIADLSSGTTQWSDRTVKRAMAELVKARYIYRQQRLGQSTLTHVFRSPEGYDQFVSALASRGDTGPQGDPPTDSEATDRPPAGPRTAPQRGHGRPPRTITKKNNNEEEESPSSEALLNASELGRESAVSQTEASSLKIESILSQPSGEEKAMSCRKPPLPHGSEDSCSSAAGPPPQRPASRVPAAVVAYRRAAHRYPAKSWWADVEAAVGDNPERLQAFEDHVKMWVGHGWNPTNVKGILEVWRAGGMPSARASPVSPRTPKFYQAEPEHTTPSWEDRQRLADYAEAHKPDILRS